MPVSAQTVRTFRALVKLGPGAALEAVAERVPCGVATLRREMREIAHRLPEGSRVRISRGRVEGELGYGDLLAFLTHIPLDDYTPGLDERIRLAAVRALVSAPVNLAATYRDLGLSEATKKADARELRAWARTEGFDVHVRPRRGVELVGDELRLRIKAVSLVSPFVELGEGCTLELRRANTPFDSLSVKPVLNLAQAEPDRWRREMASVLAAYGHELSGASKKYLLLYLIVSASRRERTAVEVRPHEALPAHVERLCASGAFYPQEADGERWALGLVISALDSLPSLAPPRNPLLAEAVDRFLANVGERSGFLGIVRAEVARDVHAYVYRQGLRKRWGISFPNRLAIRGTRERFPDLYTAVEFAYPLISAALGVSFGENQCITLTLLLETWRDRMSRVGEGTMRVAVVTNSSRERSGFFCERLRAEVDVEVAAVLDINDLTRLRELGVRRVIVFSERMRDIVESAGVRAVLVNFFLGHEDVERLISDGFSSMRKHVGAHELLERVSGVEPSAAADILRRSYSGLFV